HVLMADASVQFITEQVDTGDTTQPMVYTKPQGEPNRPGAESPYGVWGAMGTIGQRETKTAIEE
ncbi:MAG: hypothetical protein AAGA03_17220, partial [Planctomycetota bacterium]